MTDLNKNIDSSDSIDLAPIRRRDAASPAHVAQGIGSAHVVDDLRTAEWDRRQLLKFIDCPDFIRIKSEKYASLTVALAPLAAIAYAYDLNNLPQARKWFEGCGHFDTRTYVNHDPEKTVLYAAQNGERLLTLADAFTARVALNGKTFCETPCPSPLGEEGQGDDPVKRAGQKLRNVLAAIDSMYWPPPDARVGLFVMGGVKSALHEWDDAIEIVRRRHSEEAPR